jgi:hypothetical protein
LGLARIFIEKARNEAAKFSVVVSQAYAIGQFCLDAIGVHSEYWDLLEAKSGHNKRRFRNDDDDGDDNAPHREERRANARGRRRTD